MWEVYENMWHTWTKCHEPGDHEHCDANDNDTNDDNI